MDVSYDGGKIEVLNIKIKNLKRMNYKLAVCITENNLFKNCIGSVAK